MDKEMLKELVEMADSINEKKIEETREEVIKNATENAKKFKKVCIMITEDGCMVSGSGINVLCAVSLLAQELKYKVGMNEDLIKSAVDSGLEVQPEKSDKKEEIKKILEEMKNLMED